MTRVHSVLPILVLFFSFNLALSAQPANKIPAPAGPATFTNFKGPKAGQWHLSAKVTVPGQKQDIIQETNACVKPGEDMKQRALGQMGDPRQGCVVTITKDTPSVGAMTTKCPNVSASVEMTKISEYEFRYDVSSSMAKVVTTARFKGATCAPETVSAAATSTKPVSPCQQCNQTATMLEKQCHQLSEATRPGCLQSAKKIAEKCASHCASGK